MAGSVREIDPDRCAVRECNVRITLPNPMLFCSGPCFQSMEAERRRMNDRIQKEAAR